MTAFLQHEARELQGYHRSHLPVPAQPWISSRYIEGKRDPSTVHYAHEKLRPILDVTYGCIVYQEQVMQIVRDLAGYSLGRSDRVRWAMSKKKREVMAEERRYFVHGKLAPDGSVEVPGAVRLGISEEIAEHLYDEMMRLRL